MIGRVIGRTLLFGLLCVAGCSAKIDMMSIQERADIIPAFQQGRTVLDCRALCSVQWIERRRNLEALYLGRRWNQLAGEISEIGYPEDLAYFWLGQAAEAEGFLPAALRYYSIANGLSGAPDPSFRGINTPAGRGFGIDVQRDSYGRLSSVQAAMTNARASARTPTPQIVSVPSYNPAPSVARPPTDLSGSVPKAGVPLGVQQSSQPAQSPVAVPSSRENDIDLPPIRP